MIVDLSTCDVCFSYVCMCILKKGMMFLWRKDQPGCVINNKVNQQSDILFGIFFSPGFFVGIFYVLYEIEANSNCEK